MFGVFFSPFPLTFSILNSQTASKLYRSACLHTPLHPAALRLENLAAQTAFPWTLRICTALTEPIPQPWNLNCEVWVLSLTTSIITIMFLKLKSMLNGASYHIQGLRQKDCTFKPRLGLHKAHRELSSRLVLALRPKLEGQRVERWDGGSIHCRWHWRF